MKKLFVICYSLIGISVIFAQAQQPTPKPAFEVLPQNRPAVVAAGIVQQLNNVAQNLNEICKLIDDGVPAQNGQPAITADDIKKALGKDAMAKIEAMRKAAK